VILYVKLRGTFRTSGLQGVIVCSSSDWSIDWLYSVIVYFKPDLLLFKSENIEQ
jgi:hypothetical protein